jgi:hypothetical protein
MPRILAIIIISCLAPSLGGCVKRNLHVESAPPGATFYFNERKIGTTPLDFDFLYYAVHKVELEKEGFERIERRLNIKPPAYCWVPFDIFFEIIPYNFWDRKAISYTLTPAPETE